MKLLFILLFSAMTALAQTPEWSRKYHTGSVTCLDFSSDGGKLLSGGNDGYVRLWNTRQADTLKTYARFGSAINSITYIDNAKFIVSTSVLDAIVNYDVLHYILYTTGNIQSKMRSNRWIAESMYTAKLIQNISHTSAHSFSQGKKALILLSGSYVRQDGGAESSGSDGRIDIWNLDSQKVERVVSLSAGDFHSVEFSRDKKYLAFSSFYNLEPRQHSQALPRAYAKRNLIYELDSNRFIWLNIPVSKSYLNTAKIVFAGTSNSLLSSNEDGSIFIYNLPNAHPIDTLALLTPAVNALAGDLRYYISSHADTTLRIWTRGTTNIFRKILLQSAVSKIAVSPDSVHFATAHTDGTVALWNIDSLVLKATEDSVFTPNITTITESQTVCKGDNAEFQVAAQSNFGEELSYQWQKGGADLAENDSVSGVHSQKLVLKSIDATDAAVYSVKVTSATKPHSISASVALSVKNIPGFKKPLTKQYSYTGQNYTPVILFHAELADSVGAQFQWFKNGVEIGGATNSQYYFERKDSALHTGEYSVRITNQCGDAVSNSVAITQEPNSISENPFKNTTLSAEPNPFKNSTTIRFSIPKALKIKLAVTDILGREVVVLKDEFVEIGEQNVVFKNENLPDGTYFITLSGDGLLKTIPAQITR